MKYILITTICLIFNTLNAEECSLLKLNDVEVVEKKDLVIKVKVKHCQLKDGQNWKIWGGLKRKQNDVHSLSSSESVKVQVGTSYTLLDIKRSASIIEAHNTDKIVVNFANLNEYKPEKKYLNVNLRTFRKLLFWKALDKLSSAERWFLDDIYQNVVSLIDSSNSKFLDKAKKRIDLILQVDPDYVDIYPELARYIMKTESFGVRSEAILKAEQVLLSAKEIDTEHANTRVLLGYVYSWQERFKEAEAEFKYAETLGTPNLWLYTNWGEMYLKKNNVEKAIHFYRKATVPKRPYTTYDRAMKRAYTELHNLYIRADDFKSLKQVNDEAFAKFPKSSCYKTKSLLADAMYLDNYANAVAKLEKMAKFGCKNYAQEAKVLSYLRLWSDYQESDPKKSASFYRKATIVNSDYVSLLSMSSKYEFGEKLLELFKLTKRGLEVRDSYDQTALLRMIGSGNTNAVKRLLEAGAEINVVATADQLTPLMIAVLSGDESMVSFVLSQNVDLDAKTTSGATAKDIALYYGLQKIVDILSKNINV